MFVWKQWTKIKTCFGKVQEEKVYKLLLLFGFIPLFIFIDG